MIVTHLTLADFRNYTSLEIDLFSGNNLFVGINGQGKTNLIEALGYLSTVSSHRVASDGALIRQGQDSAVVRAQLSHPGRQVLAEVQINRATSNRAQINRSAIKVRELPRYFSSVLFAPEDLALVRGDPAGRRKFMDELLVLRSPRIAGILADYDRVLRQRNSLLKTARSVGMKNSQLGTLEIWDERLIVLGAELVHARTALIEELAPEVEIAYAAIVGEDHAVRLASHLSIFATAPEEEPAEEAVVRGGVVSIEAATIGFRTALDRVRRAELDRGITLVGPHRDDLYLGLNGLAARGFASHGESWSFALSLKLASAAVLRRESMVGDPVLILDDVFAELDVARRTRLAAAIADFEQVLITAAVLEDVPVTLTAHVVHIRAGEVTTDD